MASVGFDVPYSLGLTAEQSSVVEEVTDVDVLEAADQSVVAGGLAGYVFELPADQLATVRFDQIHTETSQAAFISAFGPADLLEAGLALSEGAYRFHTGAGGRFAFTYINQGDADIGLSAAIQLTPTPHVVFDGTPVRTVSEGDRLEVGQRFADLSAFLVESTGPASALLYVDGPAFPKADARVETYRVAPSGALYAERYADGQFVPAIGAGVDAGLPALFVVDPRFRANAQTASVHDYRLDLEVATATPIAFASSDPGQAMAQIQSLPTGELYAGSLAAGEVAYFEVTPPAPLQPGQVVEVMADNDGVGAQKLKLELFGSLGDDEPILVADTSFAPVALYTADHGDGTFVIKLSAAANFPTDVILRARVRDLEVVEEPSEEASPSSWSDVVLPLELVGVTDVADTDAVAISLEQALLPGEGLLLQATTLNDLDDVRVLVQEGDGTPLETLQGKRVTTLITPADATSLRLVISGNPTTRAHAYQLRLSRVGQVEADPWASGVEEDLGVVGAEPVVRWAASARNEVDAFTFDAEGGLGATESLVVRWENHTSANPLKVVLSDAADAVLANADYVRGALAVPAGAVGPFTVSLVNDASAFGGDRLPEVYSVEVARVAAVAEVEPNDGTNEATEVALPAHVVGQSRTGEVDVYRFVLPRDLESGEALHVGVNTLTLKPVAVALLDEAGTVLEVQSRFNVDATFDLPVGAVGTPYFVAIEHTESSSTQEAFYEASLGIDLP